MPTTRLATEDAAGAVRAIYAPLVAATAISFTLVPPTVEQVRQRIAATLERWPWLVCADGAAVLGYAHAGPDRASRYQRRTAYDWSVEVSVYVRQAARRRGVARALYTSLFAILRRQGFVNAYASITLPNPAAMALHEMMGFKPVGVFQGEGYKHGAWHDVGWWQLRLQDRPPSPAPPVDLGVVRASPEWEKTLQAGLPLLRF